MIIYCNIELDMSTVGANWFKAIPANHRTISVHNVQARTALDLGGVLAGDLPNAAQSFSGQLATIGGVQEQVLIYPEDPLDLRKIGLFLAKNESITVLSGTTLFSSKTPPLDAILTGNFGQMAVFEDGAILELNCSAELPEHAPQYWKFDSSAGGWLKIEPWQAGVPTTML